jgi:hypothetical protein
MKPSQGNLTQVFPTLATPQNHLAVVSPCSSCKNQLAENSAGKPACPRRLIAQRKKDMESQGTDTTALQHLVETGTSDESLANPVYLDGENAGSILVWIATIKDNSGVRDKDGTILSPHILHPDFDTTFIQCRPLPIVPRDHEAAFFQKGAWAEGDTLDASIISNQQLSTIPDISSTDDFMPVLIDGFGSKVNFAFRFPRKHVNKDLAPSGT